MWIAAAAAVAAAVVKNLSATCFNEIVQTSSSGGSGVPSPKDPSRTWSFWGGRA
jgi:hypothetical protein